MIDNYLVTVNKVHLDEFVILFSELMRKITDPDWSNKQFSKQEKAFKIISEDCGVVLLMGFC